MKLIFLNNHEMKKLKYPKKLYYYLVELLKIMLTINEA